MKIKGVILESKYDYKDWDGCMPAITKDMLYEVVEIEECDGYDIYWFYDDELKLDFTTSSTVIFNIHYQI